MMTPNISAERTTFLLTIAYDGTHYHGWQSQTANPMAGHPTQLLTIQQSVEDGLRQLFGCAVAVRGASRTDAGVHALGQRATFTANTRIPAVSLPLAINDKLPRDIRVMAAQVVTDPSFHPQYAAKRKTYTYRIYTGKIMNPLLNTEAWHVKPVLNLAQMNAAAQVLVGEHNFLSFCAVGGSAKTFERTIYDVGVTKIGDNTLELRITGNGFLYNMVRIIAGTLVYMGYGKLDYRDMAALLAGRDRTRVGVTAPAHGLILQAIFY